MDVPEVIQGVVALALIAADFFLSRSGHVDSGLQTAVPVLVAFYFGGRISTGGAKQAAKSAAALNGNGNGNGGAH